MTRLWMRTLFIPLCAALVGCENAVDVPDPIVAEGEGEGENPGEGEGENPGEGEGEGEGEEVPGGDIDISASSLIASALSARADGISVIDVTVTLIGHNGDPVVGRPVTLVIGGGSVLVEPPGATDSDGRAVARLRAEAPADISVNAEMPDNNETARIGPLELAFEPCLNLEDTFTHDLWGPVFSRCVGCHNEFGLPLTDESSNRNILKFPGEPEFAEHNVDMLRVLALETQDVGDGVERPLLLIKPTGRASHAGGTVVAEGSPEEALLQSFIARLQQDSDTCGADAVVPGDAVLADVGVVSRKETLARAKLSLTGAPLSAAEEALSLSSDAELQTALDAIIEDARASDRVVEIYNDWLWTDRFTREVSRTTGGQNLLLNRLNAQFGARRFYFQAQGTGGQACNPANNICCGEPGSPYPGTCEQPLTGNNAADSLAREPLELVRHIWATDLRVDAIINADFTMANPYTATLYGFTPASPEWTFNTNNTPANDRSEFRRLVLKDNAVNEILEQPGVGNRFPHAGILTTHAVMQRFVNTNSNRERRRSARVVYERMLAIDIMKLADFSTAGLPPDADLDTATRTEVACTSCHAVMDPVARLLYSFGDNGEYRPARNRPPATEMFEASFMGERFCRDGDTFCAGAILGAQADQRAHAGDPVTWLAERIVTSPRFAYAMVLPLFQGLTGAPILRAPTDPLGDGFAEKNLAFTIQNAYLTELAQRFDTTHNRNLKALAKDILNGPFFRGGDYSGGADSVEGRALALAGLGRGSLITPEQFSKKLLALTGEAVTAENGTGDLLRNFDEYRLLFGGVNWESLTVRFREPNPVMMRIVERSASQVACRVVPEDFAVKVAADRRLLSPGLSATAVAEGAVRDEIARLSLVLLGEARAADDAEVSALLELWNDVRLEAAGDSLPTPCRVTASATHDALTADNDGAARAWIAVVAALLSDPLFIVE